MRKALDKIEDLLGAGLWLLLNVLMVVLFPVAIWIAKIIIGFNVRLESLAPDYMAIIASVTLNIFTYAIECGKQIQEKRKNIWTFSLIFSVLIAIAAYAIYAVIFDQPIVKLNLMKTVLIVFSILLAIDALLGVVIRKTYHETINQKKNKTVRAVKSTTDHPPRTSPKKRKKRRA